jgi:hypothetical protein
MMTMDVCGYLFTLSLGGRTVAAGMSNIEYSQGWGRGFESLGPLQYAFWAGSERSGPDAESNQSGVSQHVFGAFQLLAFVILEAFRVIRKIARLCSAVAVGAPSPLRASIRSR